MSFNSIVSEEEKRWNRRSFASKTDLLSLLAFHFDWSLLRNNPNWRPKRIWKTTRKIVRRQRFRLTYVHWISHFRHTELNRKILSNFVVRADVLERWSWIDKLFVCANRVRRPIWPFLRRLNLSTVRHPCWGWLLFVFVSQINNRSSSFSFSSSPINGGHARPLSSSTRCSILTEEKRIDQQNGHTPPVTHHRTTRRSSFIQFSTSTCVSFSRSRWNFPIYHW